MNIASSTATSENEIPENVLKYTYSSDDETFTTTLPKDAGTYTVKVESGNPNYTLTGTTTAELTIIAKSLAGAKVIPEKSVYAYTGSVIEPDVTVVLDGKTLVSGTDYNVEYSNNTSAVTASIFVYGTGNYTGSANGSFEIEEKAPDVTIGDVTASYDGKSHNISVTTDKGTITYYSDDAMQNSITGQINAGTYLVYYKISNIEAYSNEIVGFATLTITPRHPDRHRRKQVHDCKQHAAHLHLHRI